MSKSFDSPLLTWMMSRAGLPILDIRTSLAKYIRSLSKPNREQLTKHFPHINDINAETWQPTVNGLSALGPSQILPIAHVSAALSKVVARLVNNPAWFYGENGWPTMVRPNLSSFVENFWFGEFENALWVAIMARLDILNGTNISSWVPEETLRVYRQGWHEIFGIHADRDNLNATTSSSEDMITENDMERIEELSMEIKAITSRFIDPELRLPIDPEEIYFDVHDPKPISVSRFSSHWRDTSFIKMIETMPSLVKVQEEKMQTKPVPETGPAPSVEKKNPVKKAPITRFISPGGAITFSQRKRKEREAHVLKLIWPVT
ncbi:hypothetical protein B0T22DRAFT_441224 [Podospora appendiculata]|uniref:Uncharacterized protein n=1 Tax=Podospora appendiculata TaxID=314037 RepID=A0AAE0XBU4_9PEZI|nr:hypothetical protein B0T22DRAFT_441224 [Podospora appendiculata]